jgi:hypothetical protein
LSEFGTKQLMNPKKQLKLIRPTQGAVEHEYNTAVDLACLGQTHEIEHVAGYKDPVLPESELEHLTIREAEATAIANVDRINEVVLAQAKRNPWRHVLIEQ